MRNEVVSMVRCCFSFVFSLSFLFVFMLLSFFCHVFGRYPSSEEILNVF